MIAGTWSINEYISPVPVLDGTVMMNSLFCIPGYYLIEECSPTSAGNNEWFVNTLLPELKEALAGRRVIHRDFRAGFAPCTALEAQQSQLKQQQLLEHQPTPRHGQRFPVHREMDVLQGVPPGGQMVVAAQVGGERIVFQIHVQQAERLGHVGLDHAGGQSLRLPVNGADPLPRTRGLQLGGGHFILTAVAGDGAEQEQFLPRAHLGRGEFIVEQGDMQQIFPVGRK